MKTVIATLILMLLGIAAITAISEGFNVLTTEQVRRREILLTRPQIPDVRLTDQSGHTYQFGAWLQQNKQILIVDFIYTNCQSVCLTLGSEFQQLQRSIIERNLQQRVHLLSVSFDPAHDTPSVLKQYAEHMQSRSEVWSIATVTDRNELGTLLHTFGVIVIPDRQGGFQHNAALVWVAPTGRLLRVTDYGAPQALLDELATLN